MEVPVVLQLELMTCFIVTLCYFMFHTVSLHSQSRPMSGDALVGFLCMYINKHFQPKLSHMVHKKGAYQIPLQNILLIIQHKWGGIAQHRNHASAS